MEKIKEKKRVAVIGAGPVGCTTASMLKKRGWEVKVFEGRDSPAPQLGRSVNLALSARGLASLSHFFSTSTLSKIQSLMVPMSGRMIHPVKDKPEPQAYSSEGLCINSISRAEISKILANDLEEEGVEIIWGKKIEKIQVLDDCVKIGDFWQGDWVIGCDGVWSRIREGLGRVERVDMSQTYASQVYLEFNIFPANPPSLSMNHLHIWPRHDFMLIALPNADQSFTCTFMGPPSMFKRYTADEAILSFWRTTFPDVVNLIGKDQILDRWRNGYKGGLVTIECSPVHHSDKVLLLGDAAHCMVPFYGQGMNCGLEDVLVLSHFLDLYSASPINFLPCKIPLASRVGPPLVINGSSSLLSQALKTYEEQRTPSIRSIQDLAMRNYKEMSSSVLNPMYLIRKKADHWLALCLGKRWNSLYEMVTFRNDLSYQEAERRFKKQKFILDLTFLSLVSSSCLYFASVYWKKK